MKNPDRTNETAGCCSTGQPDLALDRQEFPVIKVTAGTSDIMTNQQAKDLGW
ncbi:MAG: hypothetical protein ACRCSF_01725 [Mycobacteriaceae bacterium]